jgi:archaellum component FlaC
MDYIESEYQSILVLFIISLIPTLIALYLTERVKNSVKTNFDRKIENLKKEHSLEITKFQADLNSVKTRENFKFTKLHEKRLEVLAKTYEYLNKVQNQLNSYVIPAKNLPQNVSYEENEDLLNENYRNAHNEFVEYFANNIIYFDEETENLIDHFIKESLGVYNDYFENHFFRKLGDTTNQQSFVKAAAAYKKIPEKVEPLKKKIKIKFQILLND